MGLLIIPTEMMHQAMKTKAMEANMALGKLTLYLARMSFQMTAILLISHEALTPL